VSGPDGGAGELPAGLHLVRTTAELDETSVPPGLLATHRVATGVWGRIVVRSGSLHLVFEDEASVTPLAAGDRAVLAPGRPHHVELVGPVRFVVEFHR
jgi:tellurite resistance-related uncharacterized protein